MHIGKYKIQSCCAMILHYTRGRQGTLNRDNIDVTKTPLNYEIGHRFSFNDIKKEIERIKNETGRSVRSDAVIMSDIVITAPPNVKEPSAFFQAVYDSLLIQLYAHGLSENAPICGYVHLDETTPHMHLSFLPLKKNKNKIDVFSFKTICKRAMYQKMHKDTEDYCEKKLGYRPSLLISEDENLNSLLSRADIDQKSYKRLSNRLENEIDKEISDKKQVLDEKKATLSQLKATLKTQKRKSTLQKLNPFQKKRLQKLNELNEKLNEQNLETASLLNELQVLEQLSKEDWIELKNYQNIIN